MTSEGGAASHTAALPTAPSAAPTDVLEERLIEAEYKIWKKNTPYLYDFVLTHSLEWPSLTCQWLPTTRSAGDQATEHSLLLGTHTTGEQNYLMVASCALPNNKSVVSDANDTTTTSTTTTGRGSSSGTAAAIPPPRYDEDKKEVGGFGHANSNVGKIEIKMKIKHEGEVNRARYMPQNHFIVATRGPNPEVYVFDLSKHPSIPPDDISNTSKPSSSTLSGSSSLAVRAGGISPFCPQGVCVGHNKEGYALVWSKHKEGFLVTGSEDNTVRLWDVEAATAVRAETGTQIKSLATFEGHTAAVEDVDVHSLDSNVIGSVGDDSRVVVWDIRDARKPVHCIQAAHDGDINCIAFNPAKQFMFATGGADKTVGIWDMRSPKKRMRSLDGHSDQVYMVQWAPFNESILGSCSADRRVGIWDLSRFGMEQSPDDAEDGPPELLFLHGGHTSKVSEFSWNTKDFWTVASVADDNVLQVWNMAEEIYALNEDEDEEAADQEDHMLGDDEMEDD